MVTSTQSSRFDIGKDETNYFAEHCCSKRYHFDVVTEIQIKLIEGTPGYAHSFHEHQVLRDPEGIKADLKAVFIL